MDGERSGKNRDTESPGEKIATSTTTRWNWTPGGTGRRNMMGNRNGGNENRSNGACRELGRGNGRCGRKAAIATALAAAFAIGAFAGYGASSFGIWKHNDRPLDEREADEKRQQERYKAIQSVDGMTLDEADNILKSYHAEYVCVRSKKSTVPAAWQGDARYFNDTFDPDKESLGSLFQCPISDVIIEEHYSKTRDYTNTNEGDYEVRLVCIDRPAYERQSAEDRLNAKYPSLYAEYDFDAWMEKSHPDVYVPVLGLNADNIDNLIPHECIDENTWRFTLDTFLKEHHDMRVKIQADVHTDKTIDNVKIDKYEKE